ncbi:MAG TPA: acyl-CoA dehydrogenase domain-containing protein, partial [Candidatus Saccharimonadales bacterium]|nr:acyl-CoA dehydrogenase domain-containing protein [Candidatus Saccharimonadales bacterium]
RLEAALGVVLAARPARRKLAEAVRRHRLPKLPPEVLAPMAEAEGILDASERASIEAAEKIRDEVVQVDAFAEIRSDPGGPGGSDARRRTAPHVTV